MVLSDIVQWVGVEYGREEKRDWKCECIEIAASLITHEVNTR